MPTNKRPRKQYRPKPVRFTSFDPKYAEEAVAKVIMTALGAYITLQRGRATNDQMRCIRDCINLATALWCLRRDQLERFGDGTDLLNAACPAIASLISRCRMIRGQECNLYAGTPEEVNAIQDAIGWCTDIIRDRLESEFRFVSKVFINLCHHLGKPDVPPLKEFDEAFIKQIAGYEPWPTIKRKGQESWRLLTR